MSRICTRCKVERPSTHYCRDDSRPDGIHPHCSECRRLYRHSYYENNKEKIAAQSKQWAKDNPERRKAISKRWRDANPDVLRENQLRNKFGIDLAKYKQLQAQQDHACGICGHIPLQEERMLAVDHNHDTGEVRGLLCITCNSAIGYLDDDVELLRKAVRWLKGE